MNVIEQWIADSINKGFEILKIFVISIIKMIEWMNGKSLNLIIIGAFFAGTIISLIIYIKSKL